MSVPMYTVWTAVAMAAVVLIDLAVLRTRLVTSANFWITIAVTSFFQVFVDGWLTREEGTIVHYRDGTHLGLRVFYNSPIEDFGFGFALILLTLAVWRRVTRPSAPTHSGAVAASDRSDPVLADSVVRRS